MKNEIEQQIFQTNPLPVVKTTYKDSVYYVAGKYDLTRYVENISTSKDEEFRVEVALKHLIVERPEVNKLNVPMFDFILLDDPKTTPNFVSMYCYDVLHFDDVRCNEVIEALNTVGSYYVGTYSDELTLTLAHLLEEANSQLDQNLGWNKMERQPADDALVDSMVLLEKLIERDYPQDL